MSKYSPKTKDELIELVNNINLILRYINTSIVTNMSGYVLWLQNQ
ncbi:hypothetical protein [Campylobacter devanensis]|nr:hypothetical protein [Campylobacter sp. P0132]